MSEKEFARIVKAENKLKNKIGGEVNIKELLRPEVVQAAQEVIQAHKPEFMSLITSDLRAMEEIYHKMLSDADDLDPLVMLIHKAESIRDRAGTIGYQLASQIAKSLAKYTHEISKIDQNTLLVVRKHLDGLQTVFRDNVEGAGGIVGVELMNSMQQLINKYHSEW